MTQPNKPLPSKELMEHERQAHALALAELAMPGEVAPPPAPADSDRPVDAAPEADRPPGTVQVPEVTEEGRAEARDYAAKTAGWPLAERQLDAQLEDRHSPEDSPATKWIKDNLSPEERAGYGGPTQKDQ